MAIFEFEFLQSILGAPRANARPSRSGLEAVVSDSRKAGVDTLFVALEGEKQDAHQFIEQTVQKGCGAVVCRKDFDLASLLKKYPDSTTQFYVVEDTLIAFRKLAKAWREKFNIPILCVAGSVGKTTSKELLAAILRGKFKNILKTEASQNGFVGIPMTLLSLRTSHQAAVIEVGIDEVGAMAKHLDVVCPTAAIITAIGPEHLEKLIDVETVAHEESLALTETAKHNGVVAVSLIDDWIKKKCSHLRGENSVYYTFSNKTFFAKEYPYLVAGKVSKAQTLEVSVFKNAKEVDSFSVKNPLLGAHNQANLLGVVALASKLGLTGEEISKGLATFEQAAGRSEVKKLSNNVIVFCDYYNANPTSVAAAVEMLSTYVKAHHFKRKIVCLGDMLELGEHEQKFHRELAGLLFQHDIDQIYLFGQRMRWLEDELTKINYQGKCWHFETHAQMAEQLKPNLKTGDVLLIKGSRSMKMEEVFKLL